MSKLNLKSSDSILGNITSLVKSEESDGSVTKYFITIKADLKILRTSDLIHKNSIKLKNINPGTFTFISREIFVPDTSNKITNLVYFEILEKDTSRYDTEKIINFTLKGQLSSLDYSTISNSYTSILLSKMGSKALNNNSGIVSKNKKKLLKEIDSAGGTVPTSSITTGKVLQSFKDPYEEFNLIEFKNSDNVHQNVGVTLKQMSDTSGFLIDKFYITTDSNLLQSNMALRGKNFDYFFKDQFQVDNSKIIDTPNTLSSNFTFQRDIKKNVLEDLIFENNFKEEYSPYDESSYIQKEDISQEFYNKTYDSEKNKNYSLGKQKQIKILIDFTSTGGQPKVDLNLLNTKFAFNYPQASTNKNDFLCDLSDDTDDTSLSNKDKIINTKFFNFIRDTKYSVSSHFMPTAYWDFQNKNWNYLQGLSDISYPYQGILSSASYFRHPGLLQDNTANFPSLGERKEYTDILNDIIFESNQLKIDTIIRLNEENRNSFHFSKPLLTTPGMRNDGSFLKANIGEEYNKSPLSQISDSYGFPWKATWQPHQNHQLDMSKYIAKDFLLEKVVFEGVFSSRGEMPTKKGNFYSGYLKSDNESDIVSVAEFKSYYGMKDDNKDYISNNISFFLLNERKNQNYFTNNIDVSPLQHYNFLLTDNTQSQVDNNNIYKNSGKKLNDLEGDFTSYENFQNKLKVKSYIVPSKYLYNLDLNNTPKTNALNVFNLYYFKNNDSTDIRYIPNKIGTFNKSNFLVLKGTSNTSLSNLDVDKFYENFEENNVWQSSNFNEDLLSSSSNLSYDIEFAYQEDLDTQRSRDLVSYSNMLITCKKENTELDNALFSNIDEHVIITKNSNPDPDFSDSDDFGLNINIDKRPFKIESFCKNQLSSSYTDESEYKLKSNYYEQNVETPEQESKISIRLLTSGQQSSNYPIELFNLSDASGNNGTGISSLLGKSLNSENVPYLDQALYSTFSDSNANSFMTRLYFTYNNPSGLPLRNGSTSSINKLNITNFITKTSSNVGGTHVNNIFLNLRLFDTFTNSSFAKSILSNFISITNTNIDTVNLNSTYFSKIYSGSNNLDLTLGDSWDSLDYESQEKVLLIIITMCLYYPSYLGLGSQLINTLGINQNIEFPSNSFTLDNSNKQVLISYLKSNWSPLQNGDLRITDLSDSLQNLEVLVPSKFISITGYDEITFSFLNTLVGNNAVISNENYYNLSYNLEGKYLGNPNGLGIESDRLIDKSPVNDRKIPVYRSKSGKYLQKGENKNSVINSSYLLKPHDKLVLGVSSNANGQVMPTVFKLHDKLEITLIGRDFNDDVEYKNNESSSIKRTVIGDDFIKRTGSSIYQTVGSYYDQVWENTGIENSLKDFKNKKSLISLNSSREFGSYIGFLTASDEYNLEENIYIKDTVNPSIGFIYKNCLNKNILNLIDLNDVLDENEKSSNKIIITESFTDSEITDYNLDFSDNLINNWHKTYHLQDFKSILNNNSNIIINDKTSTYFNSDDSKSFIYYDIDSYSSNYNKKIKKYISLNNEDAASSQVLENSTALKEIYDRYQSLKDFVLPNSSLDKFQNGLQIQNFENFITQNSTSIGLDSSSSQDFHSFIKSNKNINKSIQDLIRVDNLSLQYFNSGLNLREHINDIDSDANKNNFFPQWHIVLELNQSEFNFLTNRLDSTSKDVLEENSIIDIFMYQNNTDESEDGISKIAKITKIDTVNDFYQIVIPLYFWETLEFNQSYFNTDSNIRYGRYENRANSAQYSSSNPAWYAELNDSTKIIDNLDVYDLFVTDSKMSDYATSGQVLPISLEATDSRFYNSSTSTLRNPWTLSEIDSIDIGNDGNTNETIKNKIKLIDKSFFISLSKFTNSEDENRSPDIYFLNSNTKDLNNSYILDRSTLSFIHRKYFENNTSIIDKRQKCLLRPFKSNEIINEKIYRSKVYKKSTNGFIKTKSYLVYKIHKLFVNTSGISNQTYQEGDLYGPVDKRNEYVIIEIISFDTDNQATKTDFIDLNRPCLEINQNDTIRIYEESLKKHFKLNENIVDDTAYFEIKLSSQTSPVSVGNVSNKQFNQVPYTHLSIVKSAKKQIGSADNSYSTAVKTFSQIYDNNTINIQNKNVEHIRRFGTPIFEIEDVPKLYKSIVSQEETMKNFFYGFSKGKYRYPIESLDGFKYGVMNGSKKSNKFYFNVSRFGHFSDMTYGSVSYTTISRDSKTGNNKIDYLIKKKFIDNNLRYITASNTTQTYNVDSHARSYYPYIENSENTLSQINSSHPNYDVNNRF